MKRPNILIMVPHDVGTHLHCYGNETIVSPHLDALAADGIRFAGHFSTASVCSPARGSIITGKWPHTHGLMGLVNVGWDLPTSNRTDAQRFGAAGYETFLVGLQHEVKAVEQLGFDHVPLARGPRDCASVASTVEALARTGTLGRDKPFYMRLGFEETHRDWDPYIADGPPPAEVDLPPYLKDTPGARYDMAGFHGGVKRVDAAIGRVLNALREAGLEDNTLVIFTTDHGIDFPRAKATLYDPGIRTALIMRWPAGFAGGRVVSDLTSHIDILPAMLKICGIEAPAEVQGCSFLPLLRGEGPGPNRAVYAEKNVTPIDYIRCVRTERWKFIRNFNEGPLLYVPPPTIISATGRDMGDDHLAPRPMLELYDLENDPDELRNLAGNPEVASVEKKLQEMLEGWMKDTNDPLLTGSVPRPASEREPMLEVYTECGLEFPEAMKKYYNLP